MLVSDTVYKADCGCIYSRCDNGLSQRFTEMAIKTACINKVCKIKGEYIEQELNRAMKKLHRNWKCEHCEHTEPEAYLGTCSHYGFIIPIGHTCGFQSDYNYEDVSQANPDLIENCTLDDDVFNIDDIRDLTMLSDSLESYDLLFRCANKDCQALTGEEL